MTTDTLSPTIENIIEKLETEDPKKPSEVVSLLKKIKINQEDLIDFADFDHPSKDSYGRKMVYQSDNFEVMVMSWNPGDISAIHDHGHTQWGAVKIFGRAEHATFRWDDEQLHTLARWTVNEGDIVGVGHSLIHQMGNIDQKPFLSLHIYGTLEKSENITGDARIFDLNNKVIQRVDGGAFFNLREKDIKVTQTGPKGDFPTFLRHQIELYKRKTAAGDNDANDICNKIFSIENRSELLEHLGEVSDSETGKHSNSLQWKILINELKVAAELQNESNIPETEADSFHKYAEIYDHVIGHTSLDSFMKSYIDFFQTQYKFDFSSKKTISVGCGTGLVEEFIKSKYDIPHNNIYGMDLSSSMVSEARKRINADTGDIMELDPNIRKWDLVFSGLNVFQYIEFNKLESAIEKTASILNDKGFFLGDFITPDHIRWYPNIMKSENEKVISLRTPEILEIDGLNFQESEIVNISFLHDKMEVNYAGKHKRYLPAIIRIRSYFEKYFKNGVELYDAISLNKIESLADSCPSTRYIVIAKK
jgi:SAM-dependent methyltransferase/predicted metal-dependent enzyme (double-stranded beta helix superfamily)